MNKIKLFFVNNWQKMINKFLSPPKTGSFFYSLTPTDQIKDGKHYFDALSWALNNRKSKNIRNIALTGSYGSGKSSILQSFQKNNIQKNLHFLNISLATFKEEKETKGKTEGENLQRLIELSIIQQLFYREKDFKLPDSRLKKIKKFSWWELFFVPVFCFFFIIASTFLIKPNMLSQILPNINLSDTMKIFLHYSFLITSTVGVIIVIRKTIRMLYNLKISKLNINNAEIHIAPEINQSVLNHNLEEILYFFEATKYNVIIFEDLDRFQETDIFTKLREINLLINNSKKINRNVVFIYAIRDEMFTDKDRTKFFDFIIPVIPVINSSNSNEILRNKLLTTFNVSESLIDDISLFIDEMRVLYNIINEFTIYKQLLSKNNELNPDKLLAIIVYKNIYPNDFVKLSNYEGDLYDIINKRHDYIKQQAVEIDKKILDHKNEINTLESLKIKNVRELHSLYVLQFINGLNSINSFNINNQNYNFTNVLDDDIFSYFIDDNVYYNLFSSYGGGYGGSYRLEKRKANVSFSEIEKQVDSEYTYKERKRQVLDWNNGKVQELKQKIALFEKNKNELRHEKICSLISNKYISIEMKDNKQKLILLLLRNGYIDENYLDYISLFHEGSLSKNDHIYLLNVKSQISTSLDQKLNNIKNLIKKIHINDFRKEYILNYNLLEFILTNDKYEEQKNAIFSIFKNQADKSIKFINNFIDNGININLFIRELYCYQINVFDLAYKDSSITPEKMAFYFKLIIENVDAKIIKAISEKTYLPKVIADNPNDNFDIFNLINDDATIKNILKAFDIKFNYNINASIVSQDMLDYIHKNSCYVINIGLLKTIMQANGKFNQTDFDTKNYYMVKNSDCDSMNKYIKNNIGDYIKNVYLKLEHNTNEDEDCLCELLNNKDIDKDDKNTIIQKSDTKISDSDKIDEIEIENILFHNSKVVPIWKNMISNFYNNEEKLDEACLVFLNNIENAKALSMEKIEKNDPDEESVKKYLISLILNNEINNNSYAQILNSIPYYYNSLKLENLDMDKIKLLVEKNVLGLSEENYEKLKEYKSNLHIKLIEKCREQQKEIIYKLSLDYGDIIKLLESSVISLSEKQKLINHTEETIVANSEILNLIGQLVMIDSLSGLDKNILKTVLIVSKKTIDYKIALFNKINHEFDNNDITDILLSFPEPYFNITKSEKKYFIPNTSTSVEFLNILKSRKYIKNYRESKNGLKINK